MRFPLALLASLSTLAACGGRAESDPAAGESASAAAAPPVVTIIARDFAYEAPDTIAGGLVTLRLVNEGPDLHHVQLVRFDDGKTYADFGTAMQSMQPGAPPPAWIHDVAGPNSPVPGGQQELTQELLPGNYAIVCFIDTPDHVPHVAKGMVRPLTVVASNGPVPAAPATDVTITMSDYDWTITPALTSGKHVIKLLNTAAQSHEMFIARLDSGKTAADLMQWAETYKGPPPGTPIGGISGMPQGATAYLPVDLSPGEYVLLCFLPDAGDGKPHVAHGMVKTVTIS
ncbi:MAG: hypothetical protein IT360_13725 [Gemmatimonadaceae bacterium]|nr:hypothetical protein [Gemmatimonadaceae bacterium]